MAGMLRGGLQGGIDHCSSSDQRQAFALRQVGSPICWNLLAICLQVVVKLGLEIPVSISLGF